jgi:hypothetical protein
VGTSWRVCELDETILVDKGGGWRGANALLEWWMVLHDRFGKSIRRGG